MPLWAEILINVSWALSVSYSCAGFIVLKNERDIARNTKRILSLPKLDLNTGKLILMQDSESQNQDELENLIQNRHLIRFEGKTWNTPEKLILFGDNDDGKVCWVKKQNEVIERVWNKNRPDPANSTLWNWIINSKNLWARELQTKTESNVTMGEILVTGSDVKQKTVVRLPESKNLTTNAVFNVDVLDVAGKELHAKWIRGQGDVRATSRAKECPEEPLVIAKIQCVGYVPENMSVFGVGALKKVDGHRYEFVVSDLNQPQDAQLVRLMQGDEQLFITTTDKFTQIYRKFGMNYMMTGLASGLVAFGLRKLYPNNPLEVISLR